MGAIDNLGKLTRRSVLGIELGREVSAVEVKGDPPVVGAAGHTAHAGYSGPELGSWLGQWLKTIDAGARSARAVVVEGDVYHHLVTMPEMSDSERHLAVGAEVRKLVPVPSGQLTYSHLAVGYVQEGGVSKQKVLIAAVDKSTMRSAGDAIQAAGLSTDAITTVPMALVRAAELLPPAAGGTAIAYLAAGRSYLVVFQNGVVELVRDFALRADDRDVDAATMSELIATELRRSFLYFGQRVQGATVERLVLAGPMSNLDDVSQRLREALGIDVEPFDASASIEMRGLVDDFAQPALAVALGAAMLSGKAAGNLIPPETVTEERVQRFTSIGRVAAILIMVLLLGWGLLALLDASVRQRSLATVQDQVTRTRQELDQARATAQQRLDHVVREAMLESRGIESTAVGVLLQRIGQRIPDQVTLEQIVWQRVRGPRGEGYWDAQITGLALGSTRSESQALFNRFYGLLAADPVVEEVHLVEPLLIGTEAARMISPLTAAARDTNRQATLRAPAGPERGLPRPGETRLRTSFDDLPPFGPTATSVGFNMAIQLKALGSGGGR